ncbi:hypothetical protein V6767_12910 [Martelella sp. FLE1502]
MHKAPDAEEQKLLASIGNVVVDWNALEASMELLVYTLSGGGKHIDVLTAHMNNTMLLDAFRTLANDFAPEEYRDDLEFIATMFDRLRSYRNYYVHGIKAVTRKGGRSGPPIGVSQSVSARSRLKLHQAVIEIHELEEISRHLNEAKRYVDLTFGHLSGIAARPGSKLPSRPLERPQLPDRLQKPILFLLDASRLPPASQAS